MDCICSNIANLSAHLHRLPTPPPYLRQMRLSPGRVQVFGAGYGCRFSRCRCLVLDMAAAWSAWRCRMANYATGCPWQSSCKSPRTLQKCKLLITRQLTLGAVLGEHKLSSPSTRLKVNRLCIRCLCFGGVRGDLQEGHGCAFRCQYLLFPLPIPFFPSTKSRFLCASVISWFRLTPTGVYP